MIFQVINYDVDHVQSFYDHSSGDTEREVMTQIGDLRTYAAPVCAFTVRELRNCATALGKAIPGTIARDHGQIREEKH